MKKSIAYLPKQKQEDLRHIVELVRKELPSCEMIILYGSYARNTYVDYDQRIEYGVPTYFMSDYDILIVTRDRAHRYTVLNKLDKVKEHFYKHKNRSFYTSIQFIVERISSLNRFIDKGLYFYTDIKKEGILLYDSEQFKLARRRKLNYNEIEGLAKMYFRVHFGKGEEFLLGVKFYNEKELYKMASFLLHQACENFYNALILTYTLYTDKDHNLESLSKAAKRSTLDISTPFPRDTEEEKRLFQLLVDAYIQSRYNVGFMVKKEDIEALVPKVELLRDIVRKCCEERIKEYGMKKKEIKG
ncbi:HEPN domain-containing protein [Bacteroides sp.]